MQQYCFLNGAIIPLEEAKIGVRDLGVVRGFGIYEGITALNGEPFRFGDHWERFATSAKALGLTIPFSRDEVLNAIRALLKKNKINGRADMRMILTGGETDNGIDYVPGHESFFITASVAHPYPAALYERGGRLISYEHQRAMPTIKSLDYITAVILQKKRRDANAIEILYTADNNVLECATSNVFLVKNGAVITPNGAVLGGITRKVALELAREAYPVEERTVSLDELLNADEVFITSSFKDVMPIVEIDTQKIGNGVPGPVTRDLMARFAQYFAHD